MDRIPPFNFHRQFNIATVMKRTRRTYRHSLLVNVITILIGVIIGQFYSISSSWICQSTSINSEHNLGQKYFRKLDKLKFPENISKLYINIGPNLSPVLPPASKPDTGVLVVEANVAIANNLRERYQKGSFSFRFFVICSAVAPMAKVGISNFHFYNDAGQSSSLSTVNEKKGHSQFTNRTKYDPSERYGPGPVALDFVSTVTLDMILAAIPEHISIEFLKVDAQGYDLQIVKSAQPDLLRKIRRIEAEIFLGRREDDYTHTSNGYNEWLNYMGSVGYMLESVPQNPLFGHFFDGQWIRNETTLP